MSLLLFFTSQEAGVLTITTTSLPDGTVGAAYSQFLTATGGTEPYSWAVSSGALPDGLSLNASTGEISGTPTTEEEPSFTVEVTDDNTDTDDQALTLEINLTPTVPWPPSDVAEGYQAGQYGEYINLSARVAALQSAGLPTGELEKVLAKVPTPP